MAKIMTTIIVTKGHSQKAKNAAAASKKPKKKASHPPTSEMVTNAIRMLRERKGSSLPAIKKYLAGHYKVDVDKLAPFIKKYLRSAVLNGVLIQTRGKGASGSFKLSKSAAKEKPKAAGASIHTKQLATKVERKTKARTSHPPTSEMVTNAIRMLGERKGSSLQAIKKYLTGHYKVDADKLATYIKKYLRSAVLNGVLIQAKGKGASGSFKLSKSAAKEKPKSPKAKEGEPAALTKVADKLEEETADDSRKQPEGAKEAYKKKTAKKLGEVVMHPNNGLLQNLQMLQQILQN